LVVDAGGFDERFEFTVHFTRLCVYQYNDVQFDRYYTAVKVKCKAKILD